MADLSQPVRHALSLLLRELLDGSSENSGFVLIQTVLLFLAWALTVAYLGGPRLQGWIERLLPGGPDFVLRVLPWRWKRLQRDFSAILVALLEAGVPEAEAVTLAAQQGLVQLGPRRNV